MVASSKGKAQESKDDHGAPILLGANSQHPLAFFLRAQSLYPVYRSLVSLLAPADIIILSRCCKALSSLYAELVSTDWNINKALQRFTFDPRRFRSALARYNAVISGSFALDFFDRSVTKSSQLEIVVGVYGWDRTKPRDFVEWVEPRPDDPTRRVTLYRGNSCDSLFHHLVSVEGYALSAHDQADDDAIFHRGTSRKIRVIWKTETMENAELGSRIKVTYPFRPPRSRHPSSHPMSHERDDRHNPAGRRPWCDIQAPVGARFLGHLFDEFATTAGANFILPDRAVSLFPALTFSMRRAYSTSEAVFMDLDYGKCAQPLVRRDILPCDRFFPTSISRFEHAKLYQHQWLSEDVWYLEERSVLGPTSWVLPLDCDGISRGDVPPDVLESGHYLLSVLSHRTPPTPFDSFVPSLQRINLDTVPVESPLLRYSYCGAGLRQDAVMPSSRTESIQKRVQEAWDQYYDEHLETDKVKDVAAWRASHSEACFAAIMWGDVAYEGAFKDDKVSGWLEQHSEQLPGSMRDPTDPGTTITIPGITSRDFQTRV